MLGGRAVSRSIALLAAQSLVLSMIAFYLGLWDAKASWHMLVVGGLTLVIKVIVLPWILYRLADRVVKYHEVPLSIGPGLSMLTGVLLVGLTYSYVVPVLLKEVQVGGQMFPVALSAVLLGCFFMISRRSAFNQLIGIVMMENGLFLCAIAINGGMPLILELGIFFDLLVGVLVMGVFTNRIRGTFDTLDTKVLNKLKG
ncbi:MAG: hypothetical protein VR68_01220 [Peptococcaceae bacterium BRH_c4a]|nr:MAG: hypothetical protein VR68_07700 [Peptococcaceae bacterium BRH_c4a]KJS03458.1 MAG: hypothetical protein VR68_01220 [Peptococcaceae bacterium BRH_c4a]